MKDEKIADLDISKGIEIKADNKVQGNKLMKSKDYDKAEDFYKKLITNRYFLNDYYPFRKLVEVYDKKKEEGNVIDTIEEFFKSERYCSGSQLLWFKLKYRNACEKIGYQFSKFDEYLNYFNEHGLKNEYKQNEPVPIAARLKTGRKDVKIIPQEDHDKKMEYEELNLRYKYAEKYESIEKALNYYEQLWDRIEFPKNIPSYEKLCSLYYETQQYEKAIEAAEKYFKSSANKTDASISRFDKLIANASEKLGKPPEFSFNTKNAEKGLLSRDKFNESYADNPKITIACGSLSRLLKRSVGDIVIIQYNGETVTLEVVKTDNPGYVYEELPTNLKLTVIKENFNVLRSLNEGELITIACKGRSQKVVLKVVNEIKNS